MSTFEPRTTARQAAGIPARTDPGRRMTARARNSVFAGHLRRASASTMTRHVAASFRDVTGLAGLSGRDAVVTITYPELAEIMGEIPVSLIPDDLFRSYIEVMRWLGAQETP